MRTRSPLLPLVAALAGLSGCGGGMTLPPPDYPDLSRAGLLEAVDLAERKAAIPGLVDGGEVQGTVRGYSRWRGAVSIVGDVLVPRGAVLVIDEGATISVAGASSSRTDPEFVGNETELLVEGRMVAKGGQAGIVFEAENAGGTWQGLVFRGAGASSSILEGVGIRDAEQGITLLGSSPTLRRVTIERGTYGVLVLGDSRPAVADLRLGDLDYGTVGRAIEATAVGPVRERFAVSPVQGVPTEVPATRGVTPKGAAPVRYLGRDRTHFIVRDTEWSGRVIVDGTVQVVAGAVLTIRPGTRVEFTPFDFDGDGIGDSQIIVSGGLKVLGEPDRQVLFTSSVAGGPGSWGMVSLLASDREDNVVRHARFERAYRGFHDHFSTLLMESTVLCDNLRGVQFQEAEVTLRRCRISRNLSGLRCRDSKLVMEETVMEGNATAASILRSTGWITACRIAGNDLEGLWIRESEGLTVETTAILANRRGLRVRDSVLDMVGCSISGNVENGLSLQGGKASVTGTLFAANGLDGISVEGTEAVLRGNDIAGNGEFAVDNQGGTEVLLTATWWGGREPAIRDRRTDAARGPVVRRDDADSPNTPGGAALSRR